MKHFNTTESVATFDKNRIPTEDSLGWHRDLNLHVQRTAVLDDAMTTVTEHQTDGFILRIRDHIEETTVEVELHWEEARWLAGALTKALATYKRQDRLLHGVDFARAVF